MDCPVASSRGEITMTLARLVRAASACEIWLGSLPSALLAITSMLGSIACTAAMKSGLSWCSKRSAHVEHGIRNAILRVFAEPELGLEPHAAPMKTTAAIAIPQAARKLGRNMSVLL